MPGSSSHELQDGTDGGAEYLTTLAVREQVPQCARDWRGARSGRYSGAARASRGVRTGPTSTGSGRYIEAGRVQALGEIAVQYLGLGPSDPALEPYLALAEEHDLPVFIHMGPGPPAAAYDENPTEVKAPNFRANAGNPLLLEEALLRHPTVRVAVMHSGWPLADEMVFMLYQHPQVYAEVGLLHYTRIFPREEYYAFLRRLVRAGFGDRILFGSDGLLEEGVAAILEADFLTDRQKRDILCDNAARFLRLDESTCM